MSNVNIPFTTRMTDDRGMLTPAWAAFLTGWQVRLGGISPSTGELMYSGDSTFTSILEAPSPALGTNNFQVPTTKMMNDEVLFNEFLFMGA